MILRGRQNDDTNTNFNFLSCDYNGAFSSDEEVVCRHSSDTTRAVHRANNCKSWMPLDSRGCSSNHS